MSGASPMSRRNVARARERRDITVPSGQSVAQALPGANAGRNV